MSCPTCDHTLAKLCDDGPRKWYHCQRCGTALFRHSAAPAATVCYRPKLVDRVRQLEREYIPGDEYPPLTADFIRLGLSESVNLPEDRPGASQ